MKIYRFIIVSFALVVFTSCKKQAITDEKNTIVEKKSNKDSLLLSTSSKVLELLSKKDFESLKAFVTPNSKVLFSPYLYIDSKVAQKLSVSELIDNKVKLNWGIYDGRGEPINATIDDYFSEFVSNKDFLKSDEITLNSTIVRGSSKNNILNVFPNSQQVEYYVKGTDKNQNKDWNSLILVFEEKNSKYYLIAVVHNEFTT